MPIVKDITEKSYDLFKISISEEKGSEILYMEYERERTEKILKIMNNNGEYILNDQKGRVTVIYYRNNYVHSINLTPEEFIKERRRNKLIPSKLELKGC